MGDTVTGAATSQILLETMPEVKNAITCSWNNLVATASHMVSPSHREARSAGFHDPRRQQQAHLMGSVKDCLDWPDEHGVTGCATGGTLCFLAMHKLGVS
jgi:hypothetical protein